MNTLDMSSQQRPRILAQSGLDDLRETLIFGTSHAQGATTEELIKIMTKRIETRRREIKKNEDEIEKYEAAIRKLLGEKLLVGSLMEPD